VPPNEKHQFVNTAKKVLQFLSAVPFQTQGIRLTAQVSTYPLRQESLSPAIEVFLRLLRQQNLEVYPGSMSTVVAGDSAAVFQALQHAFEQTARQGELVMIATFSNACPLPGT
jgi:uncharacterized protein YqgV (UPF0045/DUF77 family)